MNYIPRMRTLPEAVRELQALDPETALTLTALRRMVKAGAIPAVEVGKKRLVCLDTLIDILQNPAQLPVLKQPQGAVRHIPERV